MHVVAWHGVSPPSVPRPNRKPVPHPREAHPLLQRADWPIDAASLLFFDIETTGLRPDRGAQITEMAVVDRRSVRFDWQLGPDTPHDDALAVHLPRLFDLLQTGVVVGHNLSFDLRFIAYVAGRIGLRGPTARFVDTLALARQVLDRPRDARLESLLGAFGIAPDGALHTALVDARATCALFWALVEHGDLETLGDAGLQRLDWTTL